MLIIFCLDLTPNANDEDERALMILKMLQTNVAFEEPKYYLAFLWYPVL